MEKKAKKTVKNNSIPFFSAVRSSRPLLLIGSGQRMTSWLLPHTPTLPVVSSCWRSYISVDILSEADLETNALWIIGIGKFMVYQMCKDTATHIRDVSKRISLELIDNIFHQFLAAEAASLLAQIDGTQSKSHKRSINSRWWLKSMRFPFI